MISPVSCLLRVCHWRVFRKSSWPEFMVLGCQVIMMRRYFIGGRLVQVFFFNFMSSSYMVRWLKLSLYRCTLSSPHSSNAKLVIHWVCLLITADPANLTITKMSQGIYTMLLCHSNSGKDLQERRETTAFSDISDGFCVSKRRRCWIWPWGWT